MPKITQVTGVKFCKSCSTTKSIEDFYIRRRGTDLRHSTCKECDKKRVKENHDPKRYREQHLKRQYGIDHKEYDKILKQQNGCCSVCGTDKPGGKHQNKYFHVDHNHETGVVRGLLCSHCNTALGLFNEDVAIMKKAMVYLTTWEKHENAV